ncbi:glia maturation factor beta [Suhomyces tanzawaensis NRRL Y-17324]|uniref:Glia maturation factor beta n=1 Tax=Suhomyces tanzawaensis NRRL Y-17324 TaxID=984487 RepID=A0A1E4SQN4_9ASCO|nr:glia maturation factor beta [Suhomyces tanzawaensis NRRL Y-17324]ODV81823.1 glia maturation factor beta [Suhomyces tanzawaensis NRRL Y-17324]
MSNLYSFSTETLTALRKFRFGSARVLSMQAIIYIIDKDTYEIRRQDDDIIDNVDELVEELPDNTPRYIVLSYPMKASDGRLMTPLVLLYWIPPTSGQESRMLYAGAVEQFREKAGVSKLIKMEEEEDFEDLEDQLK